MSVFVMGAVLLFLGLCATIGVGITCLIFGSIGLFFGFLIITVDD